MISFGEFNVECAKDSTKKIRSMQVAVYPMLWYNFFMKDILFCDVDCIHLRVDDLNAGLDFYRDKLGLKLLWRTDVACGLGTKDGSTEIVISTEDMIMVDIKVGNVEEALVRFVESGGRVIDGPFNIDIGKCVVVADPFGNKYCILDTTNGTYDTTEDGSVKGVSRK